MTIPPEADKTLVIIQKRLAESLVAVYLHGSAVVGGLRPRSDVDLLVVIDQPMTSEVRASLAADWAAARLPATQAAVLTDARETYLKGHEEDWKNRQQELQLTVSSLHDCVLTNLCTLAQD
ncbi:MULTISPECIES: aminoglycoside adenylyltransferase domain-containing protein [Xenorhabdus]|uniref:aminoglycoside adenylyltransferase domain-containing protein n=1 Tax=Xenorhabdus TaxID=626 RepID=UPI00069AB804|nr:MULTISPECIES: aminoglycoside adenylyltransferase domain-containing protein [Xenorhabdus]